VGFRTKAAGFIVALVCAAPLLAAPEDDYARGRLAYQRGDVVGAMTALRAGAKAGHAPSMSMLAFILDRSDFIDEAFALYRDAAALDDADANAGLANAYLTGRGVAKDENAAFRHFSKAAELGNALSIEVVASAYLGGPLAKVAPADDALAQAALKRAALRNHLPSVEALAQAHQSGRFGLPVDPQQAAIWQARAVELRKLKPGAQPAPVRPVR
jgi:TPR repeat protein